MPHSKIIFDQLIESIEKPGIQYQELLFLRTSRLYTIFLVCELVVALVAIRVLENDVYGVTTIHSWSTIKVDSGDQNFGLEECSRWSNLSLTQGGEC